MQIENVRRPLGELREHVLRLGETWAKGGRHYGAVALRTGAQTLTQTAERLDVLATKLESEATEELVAPTPTADAFPLAEADGALAAPIEPTSEVQEAPRATRKGRR